MARQILTFILLWDAVALYAQHTAFEAVKQNDHRSLRACLDGGFDPDQRYREGATALMYAADRGHVESAKLLLDYGADSNLPEPLYGWTALHWAAYRGHESLVAMLMERGADANVRESESDQSPVEMAASAGHAAVMRRFASYGSQLDRRNRESIQDWARSAGEQALAARLQREIVNASVPDRQTSGGWPQFRGSHQDGIMRGGESGTSIELADGTPAWKTKIPGLGHSSPIVVGNQVFVTTAISTGHRDQLARAAPMEMDDTRLRQTWLMYCIALDTGKVNWTRMLANGQPHFGRHPWNTYASATPVSDGERIVVFLGSEGLHCFSIDGERLWDRSLGPVNCGWFYDPDYVWGTGSSPVIADGKVIVQCDRQGGSFLGAYDIKSGTPIWEVARDELPTWSTPFIWNSTEIITNGFRAIRSNCVNDGKELWSMETKNSHVVATSPVAYEQTIYVANGHRPSQPIVAIQPSLRRFPDRAGEPKIIWQADRGGAYLASPIVDDGVLYLFHEGGIVSCHDSKVGTLLYRKRLGSSTFVASPVKSGNRIYAVADNGEGYVLECGPRFEVLERFDLGEPTLASPALAGPWMVFRTSNHVLGFSR